MAIKVGQYNKDNGTEYSSLINGFVDKEYYEDTKKTETFISLISKEGFIEENAYYIKFSVKEEDTKSYVGTAKIILFNSQTKQYYQCNAIKINSSIQSVYTVAFQPVGEIYDKIFVVWEPNNWADNQDYLELSSVVEIYQINNLVPAGAVSIVQLGIQSTAKNKFIIDGELIQTSRIGIYELPIDDYEVSFLGVVNYSSAPFIIDYKYKI